MTTGQNIVVDMMKLEETIHFICSTTKQQDRLGAVKLSKILYYSDMSNYAEEGRSITGARYVKRQRGPVPKEALEAIASLKKAGRLETRDVSVFAHTRREFTAFGNTDLSIFKPEEIERIAAMIQYVCDYNAEEISDISHTIVWDSADMGEELPYASFLASYLDDVTEEDVQICVLAASAAGVQQAHV